jgi:hypothetical protein
MKHRIRLAASMAAALWLAACGTSLDLENATTIGGTDGAIKAQIMINKNAATNVASADTVTRQGTLTVQNGSGQVILSAPVRITSQRSMMSEIKVLTTDQSGIAFSLGNVGHGIWMCYLLCANGRPRLPMQWTLAS